MPAHQFLGWAEKLTVAAKLTEILIFLLPSLNQLGVSLYYSKVTYIVTYKVTIL